MSSKSKHISSLLKLSASAVALTMVMGVEAVAQEEPVETVMVTGYRAALESALNVKRQSAEMVDAINAEDIAAFPDANLAESLQRLPGVAVDRDNGEGRTITVRGLSADFTRVTLNGMEALSTAGNSIADGNPNRSRQFDFNTFASELFSNLKVQKTPAAATDEGSLGATVSLTTGRPFDFGDKYALNIQNAYYENGKAFNPRIAALASKTFLGGRLGVLGSIAYNMRHQYIDSYQRGLSTYDLVYRNSTFKGTKVPDGGSIIGRSGFAAPDGTSCSGSDGVIPGLSITQSLYCTALSGSDSDAYDTIQGGVRGIGYTDSNTSTGKTTSSWTGAGSTIIFPTLPTLNRQDLYQSRIGLTGSVEWQADDNTLIVFDAVYSSFYQNSTNYQISTVGLNRNNTQATLATATTSTNLSSTFNSYASCTEATASSTAAAVDCSYSKSADLYTYYTSTSSAGYDASDPNGMKTLISFVGRPSTKVYAAGLSPNGNTVNYMVLGNVDYRSAADHAHYTTEFKQGSLNIEHSFSDAFKATMMAGWSRSRNKQVGLLVELNRMGKADYADDGVYFTYDDTAGGDMPYIDFGFDAADPSEWTFVKGYSAIRHYEMETSNTFRNFKLDFSYRPMDEVGFSFGVNGRIYDFATQYWQRVTKDTLNPSFEELGVTTAEMTKTVSWGDGLDTNGSPTTSFVAPDLEKYKKVIGFTCNCVNDYGDWRISDKYLVVSAYNAGRTFTVSEHDKSYYAQMDLRDIELLGGVLGGNIGVRYAMTSTDSVGHALDGMISAGNHYNDFLPSVNLVYALTDDMLFRFGASKVMSRPQLGNMAPSITSLTVPTGIEATTGGVLAIGNPKLHPFRANTLDFSYEWYFAKGGMFSVAAFGKWVTNNPQQVKTSGLLSDFLTEEQIAAIAATYEPSKGLTGTSAYYQYWNLMNGNLSFDTTMYMDGPGGVLEGIELTYQQQLSFLPAPFDGLGVNANYTHIKSKMHWILDASTGETSDGPWKGTSPNAFNVTVYYDADNWSARVSTAFRSKYVYDYPLYGGTAVIGYSDSPSINDFIYSKSTMTVDAAFTYNLNEYMQFRMDLLNLTNQTDNRYGYGKTVYTDPTTSRYAATGRQIFMGVRLKY